MFTQSGCKRQMYITILSSEYLNSERFEPRSQFRSRLTLIVRVNAVLNRTVVVDSD